MSNEEIIEGNKLIAEFMGKEIRDHLYNDAVKWKYHLSWDWLMPVIEKISKIEFNRDEQEIGEGLIETIIHTHYPRTFGMLNHSTGKPMFRYNCGILFEADKLIEAAWMATVEFIKTQQTHNP